MIIDKKEGNVEQQSVEITVKPLEALALGTLQLTTMGRAERKKIRKAIADLPILQVSKFVDEPYRVGFAVGGFRVFPSGMANSRPFHKKTLEPHMQMPLRGSELLPPSFSGVPIQTVGTAPFLTMHPIQTVGTRLRMLPTEAKLPQRLL